MIEEQKSFFFESWSIFDIKNLSILIIFASLKYKSFNPETPIPKSSIAIE